jgi:hypothetical protein
MKPRRRWLHELIEAADQMLWGSLVAVYRKCGKPTCHCATGEKHGPVWYLSQLEAGRTRMRFVLTEQEEAARQGVDAFHHYRELGQRLAAENWARLERPKGRRRRKR